MELYSFRQLHNNVVESLNALSDSGIYMKILTRLRILLTQMQTEIERKKHVKERKINKPTMSQICQRGNYIHG